jgi:sterol desaturase/sphingolipid hydroxylase (fatty acid hydroxylase superfamily)
LVLDLLICDTGFYWVHRTLHHPKLFQMIHSQHHRFMTSVGIASEYAHPVLIIDQIFFCYIRQWVLLTCCFCVCVCVKIEQIFANFLPTILGGMLLGPHMFTWFLWMFLRILETVDAHSGYSFPWRWQHLTYSSLLFSSLLFSFLNNQLQTNKQTNIKVRTLFWDLLFFIIIQSHKNYSSVLSGWWTRLSS